MKPERPQFVTPARAAEVHGWACDYLRMSFFLSLAGSFFLILHIFEIGTRPWAEILRNIPFTLVLYVMAYLTRRAAFKLYRIQAGMPISELGKFESRFKRATRTRIVAPLPKDAVDERERILVSGVVAGTRRLSSAERDELLYRDALPTAVMVILLLANLLVILAIWIDPGVTPLLMLYFVIAFIPAMVLFGLLAPRVRRHFARSVRVVNRGGVWVELLGNTNQPWTIDGEPAEWRLE